MLAISPALNVSEEKASRGELDVKRASIAFGANTLALSVPAKYFLTA